MRARRIQRSDVSSRMRASFTRMLVGSARVGSRAAVALENGRIERQRLGCEAHVDALVLRHRLGRYLAPKGSIAVSGVSLTINGVSAEGTFDVMLVPHTLGRTSLGEARPGAQVNSAVDVLARYVARQLEWQAGRGEVSRNNDVDDERILAKLRSGGFL